MKTGIIGHRRRFPSDDDGKLSASDRKRIDSEVVPMLRSFAKPDDATYRTARAIVDRIVISHADAKITPIDKLLFLLACRCSGLHLPGYATLDEHHIKSINDLLGTIKQYVQDTSQKRPLVFLMLASPGAGKSHFIKCIAAQLTSLKVGAITYNMAGLQASEDMIPPLDAARNLKVEDRIPLLFLDEFDSAPANIPLLLPLLWDGEVTIGQRDLKLGKVVIVLAGSDPSLPVTMEEARSMRADTPPTKGQSPKLVDLLSRINGGVFSIPAFYNAGDNLDRRADKVCITTHLLRQRFGHRLSEVPLSLLKFIARTDFRYGVRSIAHLVNMIPHRHEPSTLTAQDLGLPLDNPAKLKTSSIAYHLLHQDQAFGVEKMWAEACNCDCEMPVNAEMLDMLPLGYYDEHIVQFFIPRVLAELQDGRDRPASRKGAEEKTKTKPNKRLQRYGAKARRG